MNQRRGEGADRPARRRAPRARAESGSPSAAGQAVDGPVKDRLKMLAAAVVVAAVAVFLLLLFTTVFSLNKGTRTGYLSPQERAAVAQVGACQRLGPVSVDGFGYWWKCRVTVRVADGRTVETVVDRSIVTPADAGRMVDFREACKGRGLTRCSYGRPVGRGWKAALGALLIIEWSALALAAFLICLLLVRAVLGHRGYLALYNWLSRNRAASG